MDKGFHHPEQCVSIRGVEAPVYTHRHRVKNGTCQDGRRQERGAITRRGERQGERRNDKKIRRSD